MALVNYSDLFLYALSDPPMMHTKTRTPDRYDICLANDVLTIQAGLMKLESGERSVLVATLMTTNQIQNENLLCCAC